MNKTELIFYLMGEYQIALKAVEAEKAWISEEDIRVELAKEDAVKNAKPVLYSWRGHYNGRHVTKAELQRIRLMLQKAMLEVERS